MARYEHADDGKMTCWNEPMPSHTHYSLFQRYNLTERIATAIDDYAHRSTSKGSTKVGWGCPRVRYVYSFLHAEFTCRMDFHEQP